MDYKEKYNEALEKAKKNYDVAQDLYNGSQIGVECFKNTLTNIFPELKEKENEDEKIRKEIIDFVKSRGGFKGDWIAWLENQDNKKQVERLELKAGHWYICHRPYCCRADNLTVKEGEKFQCEEDGVVKGFVIKEPEKYFMEINAPKDGLNDEVRRISTIQVLEYAKSLDAYNQYGKEDIDKNIAWLEKQGENKPADKVEPKFKVGDWVVLIVGELSTTLQIVNVDTNKRLYWFNDSSYLPIVDEECLHHWTIKDAKDGDVLVASDDSIFLFAGVDDCACKYYVALTTDNYLNINKEAKGGYWETSRAVYPATKEQRDMLFQKMKEAGYEWDVEKKELNKIESKTLDANKVIEWLKPYSVIVDNIIDEFKKDFRL